MDRGSIIDGQIELEEQEQIINRIESADYDEWLKKYEYNEVCEVDHSHHHESHCRVPEQKTLT